MPIKPKPPIASADIPTEWPDVIREIARRDGNAVRGLGALPIIEVKSLTNNQWLALMLPGGGTTFTSFDDRNEILIKVEGK